MIMKNSPVYAKRKYGDVVNTLDHSAKSPYFSLFGVIPLSKKISMGINRKGIWLWHIAPKRFSIRFIPRNCQFGFFEWKWIGSIQFSYSQKMAYFSFNDFDAVLDQVVLADSKNSFKEKYITTLEGVRVLCFPVTSNKQFAIFEHLLQRHPVPVYAIE